MRNKAQGKFQILHAFHFNLILCGSQELFAFSEATNVFAPFPWINGIANFLSCQGQATLVDPGKNVEFDICWSTGSDNMERQLGLLDSTLQWARKLVKGRVFICFEGLKAFQSQRIKLYPYLLIQCSD